MKLNSLLAASISILFSFGAIFSMGQMPAAISITPEDATVYDEITLTFDAELACFENGSLAGLPYVAMHSGITMNGIVWQYVVEFNATGGNGQSPVLTSNPDGTFSITFIPFEFYAFPAGANVTHICAVFNNGNDWTQDGRDFDQGGPNCLDFFIPINTGTPYEPGLNSIVPDQGIQGETLNVQIFGVNTHFENGSTQIWIEKDLLYIDINSYYTVNDTLISATLIIPESASTGFWSLNVITPDDGLLTLSDAFKINSAGGSMPAAISIDPPDATAYDELTLTFNPEEACFTSGSLVGSPEVFIHSGVTFNSGETWQFVIDFSSVGANGQSPQLTDNGDGTWSITFIPFEFYGFDPGSVVTQICAVFNDSTWNKDGRDFEEGTSNCADFFIPLNFSTGIQEDQQDHFTFLPNPVSDVLYVYSDSEIISCKITSLIGEIITENVKRSGKSFSLQVDHLVRGVYIIVLEDSDGRIETGKFIKE
jgi:hypothetical protein